MYGERLFNGGVKIGLRIAPGLGKELDEELGLYGHEKDTISEVTHVIDKLYKIYGDEYKAYLNKYRVYDILEVAGIPARELYELRR